MNTPEVIVTPPRKLQVGVCAAVFVVAMGFAEILLFRFAPLDGYDWLYKVFLVGGIAVFIASLCGSYCGLSLLFRLRGFSRLIAALVSLVSLYGAVHCMGSIGWAISLP